LNGRWDVFEGQFFSDFNEELHVIDASSIPKDARRFVAFDYGFDMLALLVLAVGADGVLYVEGELMESNLTLSEAAEAIVRFIGDRKR
jgi:phage terminase large subunit